MHARIAFTGQVSLFLAGALAFAGGAHAGPAEAETGAGSAVAPAALVAAAFDHSVRSQPGIDASAHVTQGFALIRRGKQAQAVKLFDKVIADADRQLTGDARPRLCATSGATAGGIAPSAVAVDAAVCDAHFGKGFALIDLGRGDLAEGELRQATQMAPGNAHFANEYAELFKSRRDWATSYELFARAFAVVDKSTTGPDARIAARALRGMGYNKTEMGEYDEAEKLFRQSLQYDPESAGAQAELGYIARKKAIGS